MLSSRSSVKYVSKSQFIWSQRYNSKITIPLRCHIPLDTIPKTIQRKINRAEKYLNSLGVNIQKIQLPPTSNDNKITINDSFDDQGSQLKMMKEDSIIDQTNSLIVGSIHQYPQITHYNQATILQIFGKNRFNKTQWSFDSKIQENYNIPLSVNIVSLLFSVF